MTRSQVYFSLTLIAAFMSFANVLPKTVVAQPENQPTELTQTQLAAVKQLEQKRIAAIDQVIGSVVAIYDDDRQGGGSGVIIDPSGIALTNHHVIMGSGVEGWGGLADGKLYRWKLIGTDPGGDVAIIQMQGDQEFPFTPLGDSDKVKVGDWALAMGNPFILTEDQSPTVTLGIVSGVKRYQPGAGNNQLVYGNCIQVDSSINPGNSGGPLFNLEGRVIGINGRGSFKERGRVNVGLGYAISANQIKNFIPDLLATKLTEHATLDIQFEDRGGKVLCSRRDALAPISEAGLELGDELIEFEGVPIKTANQFTNLICTLPEQWPIELKVRKPDGSEKTFLSRAIGLPYKKPPKPRPQPNPTPEERRKIRRQLQMLRMLTATPGKVRLPETNRKYADQVIAEAGRALVSLRPAEEKQNVGELKNLLIKGTIGIQGQRDNFKFVQIPKGGFLWMVSGREEYGLFFSNDDVFEIIDRDVKLKSFSLADLLERPQNLFAIGLVASLREQPFSNLPEPLIDGSGKAKGRNAWRLKFADKNQADLFGWFKMYGDSGLPEPQLVKLASDRDASKGGIVFDKWEQIGDHWLPVQSRVVSGLAEATVMSIQIDSAEMASSEEAAEFPDPGVKADLATPADEKTKVKE